MKRLFILMTLMVISVSLLAVWEVGQPITDNYFWTDNSGEDYDLHSLTAAGKAVVIFWGESWCADCTEAAPFMETWWNAQNPEDVYFIATNDWTEIGVELPYSTEVYGYSGDFGNGDVPLFAVVGAYNILMYGDNNNQAALDIVPEAIESFNYMGVLNPIADQTLYYGDEISFDVSNLFGHPDDEPIAVNIESNSNPTVVDAELTDGLLTLTAQNISGSSMITLLGTGGVLTDTYEFNVSVMDPNAGYIIVLDLDPTPTGTQLQTMINQYYTGGQVIVTDDIAAYPLENAEAVFVLLGIYSNNYTLSEAEAEPLATYLDNGGNVYLEGGDTWFFDSATSVHSYFNIEGVSDGSGDLDSIIGASFLDSLYWTYNGENNWIDHLAPLGTAEVVFSCNFPAYNCGIANDTGNYKTVGTSFEITGLGGNRFGDAVLGILDFFELIPTDSSEESVPELSYSLGNYPNPFNPVTKINFTNLEKEHINIEIFNARGQKVNVLVNEKMLPGNHNVIWDGTDDRGDNVASGIYLYKMKAGGRHTSTKKMILLK